MARFFCLHPKTRYQIPQRGICARSRPHSLASLEPCPFGLRDGFLGKDKRTFSKTMVINGLFRLRDLPQEMRKELVMFYCLIQNFSEYFLERISPKGFEKITERTATPSQDPRRKASRVARSERARMILEPEGLFVKGVFREIT